MVNKQIIRCVVIIWLGILNPGIAGTLRLASLFGDHMVLQQNMPVKIWGEAEPNATIQISIDNHINRTTADKSGYWHAQLPAKKAGGPYKLSVKSGIESFIINDVMFGEVWICSGQSNMFMGYDGIPEIKALAPLAQNIRTFQVQNTVAFTGQKYVNGAWNIGNPNSAVAFSFAYHLQKATGVPVGIILTSWGSSSIEGWMPRDMTDKLPHFAAIMHNFDNDTKTIARIDSILNLKDNRNTADDIFLRTQPNIIYNAMLKPLAPYNCRGLVWYQGEANSKTKENMVQYGITLPLWIQRIRQEWQNKDLWFLGVMLPGFGNNLNKMANADSLIESPTADSWAWMRESQFKALALPHTAIATTIDLGEQNNIHPKDKLPVGRRLALLAEHHTLGMDVVAQGPVVKRTTVKKNTIVVHYKNAKGLATTNGQAPEAFWLSENGKAWYHANAEIKGETVVLKAIELNHPRYVRYAFAAMPKVNLVNGAGLPARPFRTDTQK